LIKLAPKIPKLSLIIPSEPKLLEFRYRRRVIPAILLLEMLGLQLSLLLAYETRVLLQPWLPMNFSYMHLQDLAWIIVLLPLGCFLFGLYPGYGLTAVERLRRRTHITFGFFCLLIFSDYLLTRGTLSRGILLITPLYALLITPFFETAVIRILIKLDLWGTPVLVIGGGTTGRTVVEALQRDLYFGFRPVGILDDDANKWGKNINGVPIIGSTRRAGKFSRQVKHAILAMPGVERSRLVELASSLPVPHVMLVPDLSGLQSLWVEVRDLSGVVGLQFRKNLLLRHNILIKRTMDYMLGLPLFIVALPILALFAVWIKLVDHGPAFYGQEREGEEGQPFKVWKLRTMYKNADRMLEEHLEHDPEAKAEWERFFKLKHDPRILPGVGKVLRKTSLDELPQLWNVLCGEMSLVGPRPFPYYHLDKFTDGFRALRWSVLPGMTGLWQVSARSEGDLKVQENLDTYYIRNWSIWLDLHILGRTFWVVARGKGAY